MLQQTFDNDYSLAGANQNPFHRCKAPAPVLWSWLIPVLWTEEEQAEEDKKTTQDVEEEKRKDKKRDQQEDKPQPQQNPKLRKK